jgi:hypothetical protein
MNRAFHLLPCRYGEPALEIVLSGEDARPSRPFSVALERRGWLYAGVGCRAWHGPPDKARVEFDWLREQGVHLVLDNLDDPSVAETARALFPVREWSRLVREVRA